MKPITPDEVGKQLLNDIPEEVVEVVNKLIAKHWSGRRSVVNQSEIAREIAARMDVSESYVYRKEWLDFEPIFRDAGWNVFYDKPGYNEDYPATFTFTPAKDR